MVQLFSDWVLTLVVIYQTIHFFRNLPKKRFFNRQKGLFAFYVCPIIHRPLIVVSGQLVTVVPTIFKTLSEYERTKYRSWKMRLFKMAKIVFSLGCLALGFLVVMVALTKSPHFRGFEIPLGATCLILMSGIWWINFARYNLMLYSRHFG